MDMFDSQPSEETQENEMPPKREEDGKGEGETVLANKTLCPDCKPGDTLMVKVVRVHDDEMELQYVGKDEERQNEEGQGDEMTEAAPPKSKESPYASMMD